MLTLDCFRFLDAGGQLRDQGMLTSGGVAELFELFADPERREAVADLNGWGDKSVENVRRR